MISQSEREVFARFNTVLLPRLQENLFEVPKRPPFWFLPVLDLGNEAPGTVSFDDPLSFIANFLIDAEEQWNSSCFESISSGVYSFQIGECPELFVELKADIFDNSPILMVELLGQGTPGSAWEAVRAARAERLSSQTQTHNSTEPDNLHSGDGLLTALPILYLRVDSHGVANELHISSFFAGLGYTRSFLNQSIDYFFGRENGQALMSICAEAREHKDTTSLDFAYINDEKKYHFHATANALDHDMVALILRDITERVALEDHLKSLPGA